MSSSGKALDLSENLESLQTKSENNNGITKNKSSEKPFHLRHDLNQLCFEKRERKIVDRFGFTGKSLEQKKEKLPIKPFKEKKEKEMIKNLKKIKESKHKKNQKKEKKASPTEKTHKMLKDSIKEPDIPKIVEVNPTLEEEKTQKNDTNGTKHDFAEKNRKIEQKPPNQEETTQNEAKTTGSSKNEMIASKQSDENKSCQNFEQKQNFVSNGQNIETLEKPSPTKQISKKATQNKTALPFIRKRGRKRKVRWTLNYNDTENDSPNNMAQSLNKIFKKNLRKATNGKKAIFDNKKILTQQSFETNIFSNVYQEIFYKPPEPTPLPSISIQEDHKENQENKMENLDEQHIEKEQKSSNNYILLLIIFLKIVARRNHASREPKRKRKSDRA